MQSDKFFYIYTIPNIEDFMKPIIFNEALKIWDKISVSEKLGELKLELEVHKQLLNIFQTGDYYYYIFNITEVRFDLFSKEVETVLGYNPEDLTIEFLINKIHPDDQPWFLNIENKAVEFLSQLPIDKLHKYKIRYDYRIKKADGIYIRVLHQAITIQHSETGKLIRTLGVHTDISHLKMEGKPVLSFIGLDGEPSFIDVDIKKIFPEPSEFLTKRELEILSLLINGSESKEIAAKLFISVETVSSHRKNLLRKTEARNTAEMIAMAIRKGWI